MLVVVVVAVLDLFTIGGKGSSHGLEISCGEVLGVEADANGLGSVGMDADEPSQGCVGYHHDAARLPEIDLHHS